MLPGLSQEYTGENQQATAQLWLKSGLLMTNQIREFWYSYDYDNNNNVSVTVWEIYINYMRIFQIKLKLINQIGGINTPNELHNIVIITTRNNIVFTRAGQLF